MKNLTERGVKIRLLVTAFDYRPRLGGVATASYELFKAMSLDPQITLRVIAPISDDPIKDREVDQSCAFEVQRVWLPKNSLFAIPFLIVYLGWEIKTWKPDSLLNMLWMPEGVASWFISFFSCTPYFLVAHGVEIVESHRGWKKILRKRLQFVKRSVIQRSQTVFAASHFTAAQVVTYGQIQREKIEVIPWGVDAQAFQPGPRPKDLVEKYDLEGKFVFLTLSRLEDYKGVDRALGAFFKILSEFNNAIYLVGGEGPDRVRLEKLSEENSKSVIFLGKVSPERLTDTYRLADTFVLTSREDWVTPNFEGLGLVYLEAAACQVPSIAGKGGGVPDAVEEGKTGWLVVPEDEEEIAKAMREAIRNPIRTKALGVAARERALAKHRWENVARRFLEIVQKKVSEKGSPHVRN